MFNEELVELRKGLEADLRSTDRHRRARRRVEHPRRHDDRRTGLALNEHDINPVSLADEFSPKVGCENSPLRFVSGSWPG
jgi:hypothetical protein